MTYRRLLVSAALLLAVGCGEAECDDPAGCVDAGCGDGASCGDACALGADCGTEPVCVPGAGLASIGIDPLGRTDGIDITESDYEGRCYEDDALEASRPVPPDPRRIAAEEAEATAEVSRLLADAAREDLETARRAFEESFSTQETAGDGESAAAGFAYIALVTLAKTLAEEAYQLGRVLLAPEARTTWSDLLEHPEDAIVAVATSYLESFASLADTPFLVGVALDVITEVVKAEMLEFLREARDAAQVLCDIATGRVTEDTPEPIADPVAQAEYEEAQAAYEAALAQAAADGDAAIEAWLAQGEPSDLPPCDAEELRMTLDEAFCSGTFVNPISDEDEAMIPGLRASLDAYVAELCAAIVVCD